MKLKSTDFVGPDCTKKELKIGLKLAHIYKLHVKAAAPYAEPFSKVVPLEHQSVFQHFIKAAKMVIETGAEPEDFIRAQFDGLAFARKFPFPNQLSTENARLRFYERKEKLRDTREKLNYGKDDMSGFAGEERKLERLCQSMGFSERAVLKRFSGEFTKAFIDSRK